MERVPIAEVRPEVPSLDEKQFGAIVTIFWPYSSLKGHTALLLAEPDFRLRYKKGQVRVRFQGPSAKALGKSGIAIGDEVLLSLRGARFVQEDTGISTPGKSIDWELSFSQKLTLRVFREAEEIANINVDEPAALEPSSPAQKPFETPSKAVSIGPNPSLEWASPAFLKRTRLSDGPIITTGYDTITSDLVDDEGHRDKRRRRSYKDWTVWRYASRTPSPEKDQEEVAQDSESEMQVTPVPKPTSISQQSSHLPSPPVFSPHTPAISETEEPLTSRTQAADDEVVDRGFDERQVAEDRKAETSFQASEDLVVRDQDYYDLYAGPDEYPHPGSLRHDNVSTQRESDEAHQRIGTDAGYSQLSEASSEVEAVGPENSEAEVVEPDVGPEDVLEPEEVVEPDSIIEPDVVDSEVGQDSEVMEKQESKESASEMIILSSTEEDTSDEEQQSEQEDHGSIKGIENRSPQLVMPPPLSLLNTDFAPSHSLGSLTPIGKEPLSPVIKPLDSSTLPMPSPFPGERDKNLTSYLDSYGMALSSSGPAKAVLDGDLEPSSEPEYIQGSSFYNTMGETQTSSSFRPTHESAFTDLRFTFGFDGSALSRLSRQVLGAESITNDNKVLESQHSLTGDGNQELDTGAEPMQVNVPAKEIPPQLASTTKEDLQAKLPSGTEELDTPEEVKDESSDVSEFDKWEREIMSIPSDRDSPNMEEDAGEDFADETADRTDGSSSSPDTSYNYNAVEDEDIGDATEQETDYASPEARDEGVTLITATQKSEALTEIIDLGSGSSDEDSDDDSDDDSSWDGQLQNIVEKPKSPSNINFSKTGPSNISTSNLVPSQELGGTQSKFAGTSFVRDSEEETLHSENSISTVSCSDDQLYPQLSLSSPRFQEYGEVHTSQHASASMTVEQAHDSPPRESPTEVHVISSDSENEGLSSDTIIDREYVYYPDLPLNGKAQDSPAYDHVTEQITVTEQISVSTHQQSLGHSHLPFTPEQSQVQDAENRIPFTAEFAGQSLPLSPQLTQKTSGGSVEHAIATDVDNEVGSGLPDEEIEKPSMGFISSVGYYDAIRDLTSYLGRGANVNSFPASIWPDVFALVVEATTEPKRAEKYPYHYATTLRITDVSSFPQSTVVQVFRPHAEALPIAEKGDVILLRSFIVKTTNHKVMLVSGEESGWVVWRWSKIIPGVEKMDKWKAVRARMEINGPWVETQEAELAESRKVRYWWLRTVKPKLEEMDNGQGGGGEKLGSAGRMIMNGASG
jgi:hypothetical protein